MQLPDFNTQNPNTYRANIDANIQMLVEAPISTTPGGGVAGTNFTVAAWDSLTLINNQIYRFRAHVGSSRGGCTFDHNGTSHALYRMSTQEATVYINLDLDDIAQNAVVEMLYQSGSGGYFILLNPARYSLRTNRVMSSNFRVFNFLVSNAADVNNDLTFEAGYIETTNQGMLLVDWSQITASTTITKQIDATWAQGNNAGGLDTGAVAASTVYYVTLIRNNTDKNIYDLIFTTSSTGGTIPSGWTRIGVVSMMKTNASSQWEAFTSTLIDGGFGYEITFQAYSSLVSTANPGTSAVTITTTRAPNANQDINVLYAAHLSDATPAAATNMWLQSTAVADAAASSSNFDLRLEASGATIPSGVSGNIWARGTAKYRLSASNADITVRVLEKAFRNHRTQAA